MTLKDKMKDMIKSNISENEMIRENVGNFDLLKCNEAENNILHWVLSELEKEEKEIEDFEKALKAWSKKNKRTCDTCYFKDVCDKLLLGDIDNPHEAQKINYCSKWREG